MLYNIFILNIFMIFFFDDNRNLSSILRNNRITFVFIICYYYCTCHGGIVRSIYRRAKPAKSNNDILVSARPTARLANSSLSVRLAGGPLLPARFASLRARISTRKSLRAASARANDVVSRRIRAFDLRPTFLAIDRKNLPV